MCGGTFTFIGDCSQKKHSISASPSPRLGNIVNKRIQMRARNSVPSTISERNLYASSALFFLQNPFINTSKASPESATPTFVTIYRKEDDASSSSRANQW
ncbi:hypothetical protein AQUCO_00700739v1 [Aquilegia coerulea]|uniref:Uncharacterized protein n=1 Tax=Aquilegia coerulea TaxID=218851 RepID=A0A2G5ELE8_AQUCA|nr:hypothetical protein AQUCO_00700739v1 [Aquilegia coerulea]